MPTDPRMERFKELLQEYHDANANWLLCKTDDPVLQKSVGKTYKAITAYVASLLPSDDGVSAPRSLVDAWLKAKLKLLDTCASIGEILCDANAYERTKNELLAAIEVALDGDENEHTSNNG